MKELSLKARTNICQMSVLIQDMKLAAIYRCSQLIVRQEACSVVHCFSSVFSFVSIQRMSMKCFCARPYVIRIFSGLKGLDLRQRSLTVAFTFGF